MSREPEFLIIRPLNQWFVIRKNFMEWRASLTGQIFQFTNPSGLSNKNLSFRLTRPYSSWFDSFFIFITQTPKPQISANRKTFSAGSTFLRSVPDSASDRATGSSRPHSRKWPTSADRRHWPRTLGSNFVQLHFILKNWCTSVFYVRHFSLIKLLIG